MRSHMARMAAQCIMNLGRPQEALAADDEEARLAPRAHGQFFVLGLRSQAHLMLNEYEAALQAAKTSLKEFASSSTTAAIRATCLAALSRNAQAQEAVWTCRRLGHAPVHPDIWQQAWRPIVSPEAFALMGPANALYRDLWNATPEESAT